MPMTEEQQEPSHTGPALRVLFCGGGSAGHLAPSLAVWEGIQGRVPDAVALFVCSAQRSDRMFLRGSRVQATPVHAPRGGSMLRILLIPVLLPFACLEAFLILLRFRPHIIFAKGGHVSLPVALAAFVLRYPIVLHESDRVMGRANRTLLRFARHLCIGTPQKEIGDMDRVARRGIPCSATGNPVRRAIFRGTRDGGRGITGFSGRKPVLLVIGGSQGANILNDVLRKNLEALVELCDVVHLTGPGKEGPKKRHARYFALPFALEELPHLYAFADLVVSRAGAGAIAELSALGKATVLVPLPDLAHKHQEENARFLALAEAAVVLPQERLREDFLETIRDLLKDEAKRRELGERLRTFSGEDAAERIANILLEVARQ